MGEKWIPLSVPNLKGNELQYVTDAIKTEWVSTAGPYVEIFEKKVAEYVQVPAAVSCQNGTSGLHIALLLCGVEREDEVLVPTLTFIAAVNPVKYIGAFPVFMDCDDSLCLDPQKLECFCREECSIQEGRLINNTTKRQVKAVVAVHVFGNMADMEKIMEIAGQYHLKVVEDATEALGTFYRNGKYTGKYAGTIGDIGVYSFNGNKIITTGGGGMIVSQDVSLLKHAKHLTTQAKADEVNFIHNEVGYNYRMTNLQAAIGLAQLEQLESFIERKRTNYKRYQAAIQQVKGLQLLPVRNGIRSNYWFYAVYCEDDYPYNRDGLIEKLRENRIQSRPIWGLIHEQAPYREMQAFQIEKAKKYWKHVVNVPCSTSLTTAEVDQVISLL